MLKSTLAIEAHARNNEAMRCASLSVVAVIAMIAVGNVRPVAAQQAQDRAQNPWSRCCGMSHWPMGHGMMDDGMMDDGMMGSMPRHHQAMMSGIPAPYNSLKNPLPRSRETINRGVAVYGQRPKLHFLPRSNWRREWRRWSQSIPAARQSRLAFPYADGAVGPIYVLDDRRGRRPVRQRHARIQGRVAQGRYLGSHRLHTGAAATENKITASAAPIITERRWSTHPMKKWQGGLLGRLSKTNTERLNLV
jgi:hypothetical protein